MVPAEKQRRGARPGRETDAGRAGASRRRRRCTARRPRRRRVARALSSCKRSLRGDQRSSSSRNASHVPRATPAPTFRAPGSLPLSLVAGRPAPAGRRAPRPCAAVSSSDAASTTTTTSSSTSSWASALGSACVERSGQRLRVGMITLTSGSRHRSFPYTRQPAAKPPGMPAEDAAARSRSTARAA